MSKNEKPNPKDFPDELAYADALAAHWATARPALADVFEADLDAEATAPRTTALQSLFASDLEATHA